MGSSSQMNSNTPATTGVVESKAVKVEVVDSGEEEADSMVVPFNDSKNFRALSSCGERKAPEPDGFNFYFYRRTWSFMKKAFHVKEFHNSNVISKDVNTSFMILVPEVAAPLLTKMVLDSQHAFMKGITILHSLGLLAFCYELYEIFKLSEWMSMGLSTATTAVSVNGILDRSFGVYDGYSYAADHESISLRLTINFYKSSILGINVTEDDLLVAAEMVGCKVDFIPIMYLGLPPATFKLPCGAWDHVAEQFKSYLVLWKSIMFSPAGGRTNSNNK
ncbi:uncharacterized protein LOC126668614 [Mercurialis annua]|uniref:uncharacterized protein LOC126668614 n=1 Tax=Mercurialis annua TaxID=3986 RepID=UPI0024AD959A|nr:uncharacterized protein LOC126668614 [Mercurialis annua]